MTGLNCYLVVKLWQSYHYFKEISHQLTNVEAEMTQALALVPDQILKGQQSTAQLRLFYQKCLMQLAIAQKLLRRLQFAWKVWHRIQKFNG
ncbi:MAG: hypothetical protein QNJ08_15130 [Crocosphaera sp.]|nr:hypothetical protein [Crocosphaera sp.]